MNSRKLGIGIDFGTTNSAAAVFDGEQITLVRLERDAVIMPSATYIDQRLQTKTGQNAIERYIADNTGRTVELIPEVVGEVSQFVDGGGGDSLAPVQAVTQKIYGAPITDSGLQGRLFRGTKRLLGDERIRRLMVFDHPFRLVALITPLLLRMQSVINRCHGEFDYAHLGHPVNFEGRDQFRNKLALSRLSEAYRYAGVSKQSFYPEPIAAAASYLHQNPDVAGETLLTVDFGGGTLDLCVLKRQGQRFDVIATHGVGLGGDHIDQLLFRQLLFPMLGKGETWRRRGIDKEIETQFPFDEFEDLLLNWAISYTLNQNRFTTPVMECIEGGSPGKRKFERLREVIKHNMSYLLFARIKEFKAALSVSENAVLDIPEIDVNVPMTRHQFDSLIQSPLADVSQSIETTLNKASMKISDIDIVLRTGGSSLIPAVRNLLESQFPDRVVEHDPFTSVAAGLAVASFHGW
ncbi:MAG: Hsp70 family protein [Gammaproteobacteria bacterium]|nr:Hsp70 family protein [Gammaproteobacteria bacterium]